MGHSKRNNCSQEILLTQEDRQEVALGDEGIDLILPPIQEIKKRRIALGVSQKRLAASVGASQSLIAKIESNRVNPSYDVVKKIFEYLDRMEQPKSGLARDVEKRDLVWVRRGERVRDAAEKMRIHGFSQLPVRDERGEDVCVGSISERQIVQGILKEADPKAFYEKPVSDIMQEQFPVVDEAIPLPAVALLLQHSQAVLTARRGKIVGIITPSDLLSMNAGRAVFGARKKSGAASERREEFSGFQQQQTSHISGGA